MLSAFVSTSNTVEMQEVRGTSSVLNEMRASNDGQHNAATLTAIWRHGPRSALQTTMLS